jgi:hypothetical protein
MDTGKLITLGAVGIGLYLLYEWLISQCETTNSALFGSSTCSMLLGTSSLPAVTTPSTVSSAPSSSTVVGSPASSATVTPTQSPTNTLTNLLLQAATAAGEPSTLSPDQWAYYYQAIPGKPAISGAQFESILTSLGLTDATRSTTISASQFAGALISNGLSGLDTGKIYSAGWVPLNAIHGGLFG